MYSRGSKPPLPASHHQFTFTSVNLLPPVAAKVSSVLLASSGGRGGRNNAVFGEHGRHGLNGPGVRCRDVEFSAGLLSGGDGYGACT